MPPSENKVRTSMPRASLPLLVLLALAACGSSDDQSYRSYVAEREATLSGTAPVGIYGPGVSASPLDATAPAAATAATAPSRERAAVFAGISDEQSFAAVSSRETIESDAARIERNRAQYQQIQPTALPQRSGGSGPSIVEFALQTRHPVGQQMYDRSNPLRDSMSARACARYASPDMAQEAFLRAGGPERDPRSLDPDGDGYACYWDPTPFRAALR